MVVIVVVMAVVFVVVLVDDSGGCGGDFGVDDSSGVMEVVVIVRIKLTKSKETLKNQILKKTKSTSALTL